MDYLDTQKLIDFLKSEMQNQQTLGVNIHSSQKKNYHQGTYDGLQKAFFFIIDEIREADN